MDKSRLQYSARQILIHWIQSRAPLERVVSGIFKDVGMGSSERRELQTRIFLWARYWPLFSATFDTRAIDSAASTLKLTDRIAEVWDWKAERWEKLHLKAAPQASQDLRRHLLEVHGVHVDILSLFAESDLSAFHDYLHTSMGEAPLVIRCRDLESAEKLSATHPELDFRRGAFSPLCLKTEHRWSATQSPEYLAGLFEVQDESSQLVSHFCEVQPGMKILDLCSGAGGKSLHLANLLGGRGEIHCWDPAHKKLQELQKRVRRWGFQNVRCLSEVPTKKQNYDMVLVDAPCSSLGTLRRRPQLLATTTERDFVRLFGLQRSLIQTASERCLKGGTVVYATCSVVASENYTQVRDLEAAPLADSSLQSFLAGLAQSPGAKISTIPAAVFGRACAQISAQGDFSGDGFFVARVRV